jgi:hypothetical protein
MISNMISNMKFNSINLIYLIYLFLIIYMIYILIISLNNKTLNSLNSLNSLKSLKTKMNDTFEDTSMSSSDNKSCTAIDNVVDFCMNYDTCCSYNSTNCFCTHPVTLYCKNEYNTCINDTSLKNLYTPDQIKEKCLYQQKNCCTPYNSISISSDKFKTPIKNESKTQEICTIKSLPNIEQKCLELCQTTPECKSYSVEIGKIFQSYGICKLYDNVSINPNSINPYTGKPKNDVTTDYYIKK